MWRLKMSGVVLFCWQGGSRKYGAGKLNGRKRRGGTQSTHLLR
jgi:hypothetical protein